VALQEQFDRACLQIGRHALEFCRRHQIVPVIVLGRSYTIYNTVLNSNVPAILREQGAIGIPVDCYPIDAETPLFPDMYWGFGQNILRAAHQVRRTLGVYALYSSNYSCGPDSFNLHFAAYVVDGKPFAVIESDGHSGDAGTKTRVEAFLHCVDEDRNTPSTRTSMNEFEAVQFSRLHLSGRNERLLIPYMGPGSEAVAAVFRGIGLNAEYLPAPDEQSLRLGRRYTSGKECLPMPITLGSLLQRLERATDGERFVYVMTSTDGPCRFGVYNLLNRIVLERLGWRDRVRIWSPKDPGYFDELPVGTEMLVFAGIMGSELLLQAMLDVRPVERVHGEAQRLFDRYHLQLVERLEIGAHGDLTLGPALRGVISGRLFGVSDLLNRAGEEFAALRGPGKLPIVELTGEIYVRAVAFSNDFLIEKLEARGLRVHLTPASEWISYCGYARRRQKGRNRLANRFSDLVRRRIHAAAIAVMARHLGWEAPPTPAESLAAARPYINDALEGEAVLTVGGPLHEWRRGEIDAVVSVGPLECMPSKIAEAQFHHVGEREGLPSLSLAFNGDPITTSALDSFAFEVNSRFRRKSADPVFR
jgi:predicted nucleotide-binding protein (sugar kinase/HSP70/actin superfamily)